MVSTMSIITINGTLTVNLTIYPLLLLLLCTTLFVCSLLFVPFTPYSPTYSQPRFAASH